MNGMFQYVLGVVLLCSHALASDVNIYANDQNEYSNSEDARIFFGTTGTTSTTGSFLTFNTTLLLFSAGILLLGLGGAIALFFLLTTPEETGGYSSGYQDSGSGYQGYDEYGRSKSW